eukprot:g28723.t1
MDPSDGVDGGRGSAPSATPEEHPGAEQYTFSDDEEEEDDVISDVEDAAGAARRSIREPTAALRSCRRALGRPKLARAMGSVRPELDFDDVLPDESSEASDGRPPVPKSDKLLKEAALLEVFGSRSPRTTSMIWTGTKGEYDIMAMNLLGPSLEDVFMKTLGLTGGKIYVVDFGLAKSFRDGRGRHIPCVKKSGMTGTARYTTVNLHRGYEPSRRDDLGSIGYVLLYFLRGQLPWQGINHRDKKKRKKRIGKKKMATMHLPQILSCY